MACSSNSAMTIHFLSAFSTTRSQSVPSDSGVSLGPPADFFFLFLFFFSFFATPQSSTTKTSPPRPQFFRICTNSPTWFISLRKKNTVLERRFGHEFLEACALHTVSFSKSLFLALTFPFKLAAVGFFSCSHDTQSLQLHTAKLYLPSA